MLNHNSPFFHEERHASLAPFADRPITICGAGALGGNLTETLARTGECALPRGAGKTGAGGGRTLDGQRRYAAQGERAGGGRL